MLLEPRERVPQRQQAFAAEPGGAQLLPGGNSNFALVHGGRRLAAQGDTVIANDVDAHGWGLLIDLRGCAGDPTHALFSGQSHTIRDNVMALFGAIRAWNCSAANLARTGGFRQCGTESQSNDALVRSASAIHSTADQGSVVTLVSLDPKGDVTRTREVRGSS